jgi:hypothetical protein
MCEERPNRTDRTAPNVALVESGRMLTRRSLRFAISGHRDFRQRTPFRHCKMDVLRRTPSILISYRHGSHIATSLSVM